jgi:hypothetical protein
MYLQRKLSFRRGLASGARSASNFCWRKPSEPVM